MASLLTHCLVTPYGARNLGQRWLAWQYQAITWNNVDFPSFKSSDILIWAISQEMPQPSITKICLKSTYLKFYWNSPGANELMAIKKIIYTHQHSALWFTWCPMSHSICLWCGWIESLACALSNTAIVICAWKRWYLTCFCVHSSFCRICHSLQDFYTYQSWFLVF